jgi:hypothetical protein
MNPRLPILTLAIAAAALFAACGGGGGTSSPGGSSPALPNGAGNAGTQSSSSGVTVTLTYHRNAVAGSSLVHRTLRVGSAQARRSPTYVSYSANGVQLTVTSGSASQTLYYSIAYNGPLCSEQNDSVTCTLSVPTLGSTETISAIEVDQQPTNLSGATGLGTGFPSNSGVLARGSTTVAVNAGGYTTVALSLNPIIGNWYDCGFDNYDQNMNEDYSTNRIVVTSGIASSNILQPIPADYDGYWIGPGYNNGAYVGQPFIDLNAAAVPATATSTSQHVTLFAIAALASPTPAPPYAGTQTQSFPNTGFLTLNCCGGLQLAVNYDGQSAAQSTLTLANNLTATPPPFTASPTPSNPPVPTSYATARAYQVVPISVTPTSLSLPADGSSTGMVTASDAGANQNMGFNQCVNGSNTQLATVSGGTISNGSATFTVTAGTTPGTCTFTVYDSYSRVVTNAVTVTLTGVP